MMSGVCGGKVYWGRTTTATRKDDNCVGIVVMFGWVTTVKDDTLRSFVDLYSSLNWDSLVCHADFLTAFSSERALSLAFVVVNELIEVLRNGPCPVVFVALSGGSKACMYKVLQIIDEMCDGQTNSDENHLVRNCISGYIYDSSPVDFTSDLGALCFLRHTNLKRSGPAKVLSWVAKGFASSLDALYLTRFDLQRAEYWRTLYTSTELEAPFLILCSDNDEIAHYQIICNFCRCLRDLGANVKLITWNGSPHTGHFSHHPIQYRAAVTDFLEKANLIYTHRIRQPAVGTSGMEVLHDDISDLICDPPKTAINSSQCLRRLAFGPNDLLNSTHNHERRDSGAYLEGRRERSVSPPKPPSMNAHSILGQVLFDVCVPKNVEGWDIKLPGSLNGQRTQRNSPLLGTKRIRRSKL